MAGYADFITEKGKGLFSHENKPFCVPFGGDKRDRTADLLNAIQALSQLSYTPRCLMTIAIIRKNEYFVKNFLKKICSIRYFFYGRIIGIHTSNFASCGSAFRYCSISGALLHS